MEDASNGGAPGAEQPQARHSCVTAELRTLPGTNIIERRPTFTTGSWTAQEVEEDILAARGRRTIELPMPQPRQEVAPARAVIIERISEHVTLRRIVAERGPRAEAPAKAQPQEAGQANRVAFSSDANGMGRISSAVLAKHLVHAYGGRHPLCGKQQENQGSSYSFARIGMERSEVTCPRCRRRLGLS